MRTRQPHQFRTRNDHIKTQRTQSNADENPVKSTKLIDILPLITVWVQLQLSSEDNEINDGTETRLDRDGHSSPNTGEDWQDALLFLRCRIRSYDELIAFVPFFASPEHDARDDQRFTHLPQR
jgi:hypothetical protein